MPGKGNLAGDPEGGAIAHHFIPQHGDKLPCRKSVDLPGQRPLGIAIHTRALINPVTEINNAGDVCQGGVANV